MPQVSNRTFQVFAFAGGLAVGNLYLIQPLLAVVSASLGTTTAQNGWLVSATQLGYALGIILLLPLGDILNRKRLIPFLMILAGLALVAASLASSFTMLLIALGAIGISTISGQVIVPLTGELSDDSNRGKNIGRVVSGIMIGILSARTISGALEGVVGWQGALALFGIAALVMAGVLHRTIPQLKPSTNHHYLKVVADVFLLPLRNPALLVVLLLNSVAFALFSSLWTSITFLLSSHPYNLSAPMIGLFGLVGVVGAVAARKGGRLYDQGHANIAIVLAWIVNIASFAIGLLVHTSLVFLVIQLLIFDGAMQINGLMIQTRLLSKFAHARSRVNASYVSANFIGGAAGSAFSAQLWAHGGWNTVMWVSIGVSSAIWLAWALLSRTKFLS